MTKKEFKLRKEHNGKKPVMIYPQAFTKEECLQLRKIFASDEADSDFMKGEGGKKLTFISLERTACVKWVYDRVMAFCKKANAENYKFGKELWPVRDVYINRYSSSSMDHRGWHVDGVLTDNENYATRKLSVAVQLSDENEYEGGDFEFMAYHQPKDNIKEIGTLLVFPAFEWHRVTPVTKGDRFSLVLFVHGVPFK